MALAAGLLIAADAPKEESQSDQERMQGTWTVASAEISGKRLTGKEIENLELVIRGNKMTFKDEKNNKKAETLKFKLHPNQKPKAINLTHSGEKKSRGIYRLEGDRLKICYAVNGKKRPTEFRTKVGGQQFRFVLTRAKP
jgi:uncharacterized protein (TIGR03067 family)